MVQLVGGINFTLAPGSRIYLPGSPILDTDHPGKFLSEVHEPASFSLPGVGLSAAGLARRRRASR